jgi:hypothetical protein
MGMKRAYYSNTVCGFLRADIYAVLGEIVSNNTFELEELQRNTWQEEIRILRRELSALESGQILFEYTIPRIGKRIDNILLYRGIVFLLEFKVGETSYNREDIVQVEDYALDLTYFHKESRDKLLVPAIIATSAPGMYSQIGYMQENILAPVYCNSANIGSCVLEISGLFSRPSFDACQWINSLYMPTPTIIEAAQALYRGHRVEDISRNDASAVNLGQTARAIDAVIDGSKANGRKSICFITGVPGAGKTLAGLNISIQRQKADKEEHAVFLSGNGPLVAVLQEALARDRKNRAGGNKSGAKREATEFIQIIHHFRDDALSVTDPPIEKVVIFDEAQRAWTREMLQKFMKQKKGMFDFALSEPEFLIGIMDRHTDYAVIVCLVGGGQEINTGEAGISAWFDALKDKFSHWDVYVSDQITDLEYSKGVAIPSLLAGMRHTIVPELHLSVSLRSFRSEKVSAFVKALLDADIKNARQLYSLFSGVYPIAMTRNLAAAKAWVRDHARGSQRYGLTASSGGKRLRACGVWVQSKIDAPTWFLNGKNDVRSSWFLEDTATEFDIQGLELDWTIVCWDADLRFNGLGFDFHDFTGTRWNKVWNPDNITYLRNAYRVLLTRARMGFILFIPPGDEADLTCLPVYYQGIYEYLQSIGITEIVS